MPGVDARAAMPGNALESTAWAAHGAWSSAVLSPPPPPQTLGSRPLLPALGHWGLALDLFPFFPSIKEGDFLPSVSSLYFGFLLEWVWSLCRNPLLLEEKTQLSNAPGTLGKAQGAAIPGALGFAPGVGKKEINTNIGNDPFGSTFWRACGAALGNPRLLPPATPGISWIHIWMGALAGKGLSLGWVFTVTTKAWLCRTFLGEEWEWSSWILSLAVPEGPQSSAGQGCSRRKEIQARTGRSRCPRAPAGSHRLQR